MATETETKQTADSPAVALDHASAPSSPSSKKRKAKANADVPEIEVDLSLPEPPSKRAKRALKKGKPLPAKPKSDDEEEEIPALRGKAGSSKAGKGGKGGKGGDNTKDGTERSQFGIWVGNLPFTVTRPQLFQWFVDNAGGAITEDAITRVNLPLGKRPPHQQRPHNVSADSSGNVPPPNKGFAYVDFATYEAQVAACALSETEIDGRRVLIKDSKSFEGRPAKEQGGGAAAAEGAPPGKRGEEAAATSAATSAATPAAGAASTKVFVGNLGFDTSEEDLRRHFAPCGPVAWAKVATFQDNNEKCRGYGWVQFGGKTDDGHNVTPEAAAKAAAAAVAGFVKITETVDTEDDFAAEAAAAAEDDDGSKAAAPATPAKRTRQRKWWVNQLKGRALKIQFAEDDAVRYKKRFKGKPQQGGGDGEQGPRKAKAREPRESKPASKTQDASVAYRTGAVVASTGKKTMLE